MALKQDSRVTSPVIQTALERFKRAAEAARISAVDEALKNGPQTR